MQAREIALVGEAAYQRRILVHEFVTAFNTMEKNSPIELHSVPKKTILPSYIEGALAVNQAIRVVLDNAAYDSHAQTETVFIFNGIQSSFLINYLSSTLRAHPNLSVQQLIAFESFHASTDNQFNLQQLIHLLPAILSSTNYTPYYFYIGNNHKNAQYEAFPYYIITRDGVLALSYNLDHGLFLNDNTMKNFFVNHFNRTKAIALPLLDHLNTPQKNLLHYLSMCPEKNATVFALGGQPCFAPVLSKEIYLKYCYPSILSSLQLDFSLFNAYFQNVEAIYSNANGLYTYFTLDGLQNFLSTGRLSEFPTDYYAPLELEDRKRIVADFLKLSRQKAITPFLLQDSIPYSPYLHISATSAKSISVVHSHPSHGFISLTISEGSIASAIYDFLSTFQSSDFVLDTSHSIQQIERVLNSL